MTWFHVALVVTTAAGCWFMGLIMGTVVVQHMLRKEGYRLESARDLTGRWRLRVGVVERVEEMRQVDAVRWIVPDRSARRG